MLVCAWLSFQQLKMLVFQVSSCLFPSTSEVRRDAREIQLNKYQKHLPSSMLRLLHVINKWLVLQQILWWCSAEVQNDSHRITVSTC